MWNACRDYITAGIKCIHSARRDISFPTALFHKLHHYQVANLANVELLWQQMQVDEQTSMCLKWGCVFKCLWDWVGKRKFCQSWRSRSSDGRTRWRWPSETQRQTCGNWSNRSDVNWWNYKRPHTNSFKRSLRQTVCLHRTGLKRESSRSTPTYRCISHQALLVGDTTSTWYWGGGAFHSQLFIHPNQTFWNSHLKMLCR